MAYGRKRYRKKRYKKRGFKKRSFGKSLLKDARDARTSSAAELAVKIIAKREIEKNAPSNLILRTYWFGDYARTTNTYTNLTNLDRNGIVVHIAQVALMDNSTQPVGGGVPQVIFPEMRPNPQHVFGVNVIAPQRAFDGYRRGPKIDIKNVSVSIRLGMARLPAAQTPIMQHGATVTYKVVTIEELHAPQIIAGSRPVYASVDRLSSFGYSSRLDKGVADLKQGMKVDTLISGSFYMRYDIQKGYSKTINRFFKFKRPLEYEFGTGTPAATADFYGQSVISRKKLFLIIASDIDATVHADFKPRVCACTKIGYLDSV